MRPPGAVGSPRLAGFCDASLLAVCVGVYVVWTHADKVNTSRLLMGKCRVAPLLGMTIPRGELQSLTMFHRMLLVVAEAFPVRFATISAYTDSLCSVGALHKNGALMKPFFSNRVSEILQLWSQLTELTDGLQPVHHVIGSDNPADIGTRGQAKPGDLEAGSKWQEGPKFLQQDFKEWPVTYDSSLELAQVPKDECKVSGPHLRTHCMLQGVDWPVDRTSGTKLVRAIQTGIWKETLLGTTIAQMASEALSREKLELATRSFARVLQAMVGKRRELCAKQPSPRMLEWAAHVLIEVASGTAQTALAQGKLQGLGAELRGGVVWIAGRVRGETLAQLLGTRDLPVLMAKEALAQSILRKSHREDHRRSPQDIAAQSRRLAWIMGATRAAKVTANQCYSCRAKDRTMAKQMMGGLPDKRTTNLAPFEALALDLFGPFQVKDPANGRRSFKCWVVAYSCLATKAVSLQPCPGYSTSVFLDTH